MSEIESPLGAERPKPARHRRQIWTVIVAVATIALVILNVLAWQEERAARDEQQLAQRNLSEQTRLLAEAESNVAELRELRSAMLGKQTRVQTLLRSYRRPTMIKALQAGLVDLDLSETIVSPPANISYGVSFFVWTPEAGQSLSIAVGIGEPEFVSPKTMALGEKDIVVDEAIVEPLVAKCLHVVEYQLIRSKSGTELRVSFDDRLLHTADWEGFKVRRTSRRGSDNQDVFSEPNLVSTNDIGRNLSLEQIESGFWLPIDSTNYVLHHQDAKQWKRMRIHCGLQSAGPFYIDRKSSLTLGWSRFFDFDRYLELGDTQRRNIQEIISIKHPPDAAP